ncbi:MAG: hypothetical protein IT487_17425 [Chromatiaceae bacterium]|nr:hypothetical protein [Chromatiaceae bacterium]
MNLLELVSGKAPPTPTATAPATRTLATVATHRKPHPATVASVATVRVAQPPAEPPDPRAHRLWDIQRPDGAWVSASYCPAQSAQQVRDDWWPDALAIEANEEEPDGDSSSNA